MIEPTEIESPETPTILLRLCGLGHKSSGESESLEECPKGNLCLQTDEAGCQNASFDVENNYRKFA